MFLNLMENHDHFIFFNWLKWFPFVYIIHQDKININYLEKRDDEKVNKMHEAKFFP